MQNSVKYVLANKVYQIILSFFLANNSFSKPLNIYISLLQNPSYIKNMNCTSQLVVFMPFTYISIKQGLNHSNTFPNKYNPIQAIYFITVGSLGPLLMILILIYIRNPFNLYTFLLKYLTNGILTN